MEKKTVSMPVFRNCSPISPDLQIGKDRINALVQGALDDLEQLKKEPDTTPSLAAFAGNIWAIVNGGKVITNLSPNDDHALKLFGEIVSCAAETLRKRMDLIVRMHADAHPMVAKMKWEDQPDHPLHKSKLKDLVFTFNMLQGVIKVALLKK